MLLGVVGWRLLLWRPPHRIHPLPPDTGMARVRATGTLRVAMDASYPPFAVAAPDGSLHGFDVDLARAIAGQLEAKAQLLNMSEDSLPDALVADQADVVISEMGPDPRRGLAYSAPYYNAGQVLLVREVDRRATGLSSLRGATVGVEVGSDGDEWLRRQRNLPVTVKRYDAIAAAARDLEAGGIAGIVTDAPNAADSIKAGAPVRVAGPPLTQAPYVVAAAPQNLSLIRAVNSALATLQASGELQALVQRDV